jgi:hypothetical protein
MPLFVQAQMNRDKSVINNLIKAQVPELLFQKKPAEMINLITDSYTQVNYFKGVKDDNIINGKDKALEYFNLLVEDDFKSISFTIKNLDIYNDKAVAIGYYIITYNNPQKPVLVAEFIMTLVKNGEYGWLIDQEIDLAF